MKRWALVVAGLYGLILLVLALPVVLLAFVGQVSVSDSLKVFVFWPLWLWLAVMVMGQFALLAVPVSLADRRPVTRGALWPTVLAGGVMMGALVAGAASAIAEFLYRDKGNGTLASWIALGLMGLTWCAWAIVFRRMSKTAEPAALVSRQCRFLLRGSILELLIAVPTHIVARYRNYCCAGFMTFIGLTMGISVMLFSYGPAVFFLYADRWRKLHPE
jgi:hypothetical protein